MFFINKILITANSLSINKQELNISLIELLNNKSKQTELTSYIKSKKTKLIIDESLLQEKNIPTETLLSAFERFNITLIKITSSTGQILYKQPLNILQPLQLIFIISLILSIIALDYKISRWKALLSNSEKQLKISKTLYTLNSNYKSSKNTKINDLFEALINSPIIIDKLMYTSPNTILLHYYSKDNKTLQLPSSSQANIIETQSFWNKYEQQFSI